MLTRDLLHYRTKGGVVRPVYVKPGDAERLAYAGALVAIVEDALGEERGVLTEALDGRARGEKRQKFAKGLVKLLTDRMTFDEPPKDAEALRRTTFEAAASLMRNLEEDATIADYEAALGADRDLELTRAQIYADLAEHRKFLEWKALDAAGLLERYNLAQAQGLVMFARRLSIAFEEVDTAVVRRVFRWLKFCRLVAELEKHGDAFVLHVEGPAAMFESSKKYGLQLAIFLEVVPLLPKFTLEAVVELPRRDSVTFMLTDEDELVSPLKAAVGHVPEEVTTTLEKLSSIEGWTVDLETVPRSVGASGWCVPDLRFSRTDGAEIAVELFHAWHKGALLRRLDELASKPDAGLFLGVDRAVAKKKDIAERIDDHPQVFAFNKFPSVRALTTVVKRFEEGTS